MNIIKAPSTASSMAPGLLSFIEQALTTEEFELVPLAGDASSRRYYRVIHNEQSWVLMAWEPFDSAENYPFLNIREHFHKHGVKVPEVTAIGPAQGLVLLEDLGDLTLERKFWENQDSATALPFYLQAIDELVKIHYPATQDRSSNCMAFDVQFSSDKFLWEMNYAVEHLFEGLMKIQLKEEQAHSLQTIFKDICEILSSEPQRICHRDYHSRNLMLKLGQMRVIDFQDARMGPIQYDLVSLVHDSYVQIDPSMRDEIIDYYLQCSSTHLGAAFSKEQFDHIFKMQTVQRCFKACGSFSSFFNQRGDRRYLRHIQPTLKEVIHCLESFPQYQLFAQIISDQGLLEQDYETL